MPEIWGEDCLEFKPERFLEKGEDGRSRVKEFSQFKFHSFNAGPRMCLGKTLAIYEGMAVTAAILGRSVPREVYWINKSSQTKSTVENQFELDGMAVGRPEGNLSCICSSYVHR
ncbi:hypothetical protein CBS101457_001319 [Exobasidium rhododendri]|nr:hypothetical protein CBS101457_001319 [Exobasidium rhododendri]